MKSSNSGGLSGNETRELEKSIPLSPMQSPDHPKPLSRRQEQNRAAQRAFRERRAQTLKSMETRLNQLEKTVEEISRTLGRIPSIEREMAKLRDGVDALYGTVESFTVPNWSVPSSEDLKSIVQVEVVEREEPSTVVLGALRPSSTDPTLTSNQN